MSSFISNEELEKWISDISDKIEGMPASEEQTELAVTFEAFTKRLKLSDAQIHSLKLARSSCTQCLDTGYYYGGHYGAVRKECTHPKKFQKQPQKPDPTAKYLS